MAGICERCGYCCSYMSDVFGVMEQIDPVTFRIQYLITGVQQVVTIDPDKRALFEGAEIQDKRPLACPFLREREDGYVICTVYETRPDLCRVYLCPKAKGEEKEGGDTKLPS